MEGRKADNTYLTIVIPVWNREREIARSLGTVAKRLCCVLCPQTNLSGNVRC